MPSRRPKRSANPSGQELEEILARRLKTLWPSAPERAQALALLERCPDYEPTRVKLAVVKLSAGALEELSRCVEAARLDYRDVLLWAESPNGAKAGAPSPADDVEARARQIKARTLDAKQYQAWLRKG